MQVIAQIDKKFIITIVKQPQASIVFAIDQHAADERIQLEKLEQAAISQGIAKEHGIIDVSLLPESVTITNQKHIQTALAFEKWLTSWKWKFTKPHASSVGSYIITPNTAPIILVEVPQLLGIQATAEDFIAHLAELERYAKSLI